MRAGGPAQRERREGAAAPVAPAPRHRLQHAAQRAVGGEELHLAGAVDQHIRALCTFFVFLGGPLFGVLMGFRGSGGV